MSMLVAVAVALGLLGGVLLLRRSAASSSSRALREWFHVTFDEDEVHLDVRAQNGWQATFRFDEMVRVCIKMEADAWLGVSHGIYVWIRGRENSYAIPFDATGGDTLLQELVRRNVIPAELVIKAMGSVSGVFCHPPGP
jgi:hypothetical protein